MPLNSHLHSVQDVPDPQKPETWRFQIVTSWLGQRDTSLDNAGRLAQVKAKAEVLPEPFRSANLWMPEDTHITYDSIGYWVSVPWDNRQGRTTLAGDAAHPMSPRMGHLMPFSDLQLILLFYRPRTRPKPCDLRR